MLNDVDHGDLRPDLLSSDRRRLPRSVTGVPSPSITVDIDAERCRRRARIYALWTGHCDLDAVWLTSPVDPAPRDAASGHPTAPDLLTNARLDDRIVGMTREYLCPRRTRSSVRPVDKCGRAAIPAPSHTLAAPVSSGAARDICVLSAGVNREHGRYAAAADNRIEPRTFGHSA